MSSSEPGDFDFARSSPMWPAFLWHHRVHTQKAKERLYFWRLGFEPVYERDVAEAAIRAACDRHGVCGVIAYELFGVYDVLLRVWLPDGCSFDEFHATLAEELAPAGAAMLDPFEVNYMVRHWPFYEKGKQWFPEDPPLHNLQASEIQEIESGYPDVRPELRDRLERQHLLAALDDGSDEAAGDRGLKFVIVVRGDESLSQEDLVEFEEQVVEILDRATGIAQRSLYAGAGFGHFLILGRVDYGSFHAIQSQLIAQINTAAVRERFRTRTVTQISGQRGFTIVGERLSAAAADNGAGIAPPVSTPADEEAPPTGQELAPGDSLAERFEIRERLGGGGFAHVYRAFDKFEQVERAVKVFKSANSEVALREMGALRKVNHPNVVKMYWGDRDGSRWFMVCELIEGTSLAHIRDLSPAQSVYVTIQVLLALEAVHPDDDRIEELQSKATLTGREYAELRTLISSGLVHRDVKPDNIMIGDDGRVVLVDFNIASPARDPAQTTSGTPAYQAPDAGHQRWEPADDIFACGVVLYGLLTGEHPYPDARPVASLQPTDPRTFDPMLSPRLAELVAKACAPLRSERHRTARELRLELEREFYVLTAATHGIDADSARIAQLLRDGRQAAQITVQELAARAGVPPDRIERIENAETRPDVPNTYRLADVLRVDLREFWVTDGDAADLRGHGGGSSSKRRDRRKGRKGRDANPPGRGGTADGDGDGADGTGGPGSGEPGGGDS